MDYDQFTFDYSEYMDPYILGFDTTTSLVKPPQAAADPIRLSIFLIYAECAGWAALVWALVVLHRHRKHNGPIPALVIIVLLNTMLELLLNPYIITKLIQDDCHWYTTIPTCRTLTSLWGVSVISGVHLQQMMVLESVLAVRYPSCSAHVFFTPCSIILYIIAYISFFLCVFFYYPLPLLLLTVIPLISVTMISWIVVCRTPPNDDSSNRTKKPDCTLLAYATTTLIIYLISHTLYILPALPGGIIFAMFMMFLCLLSLRVVVDPLLCVLVCKQKNTESPVQTAVETERSVETQC